MDDTLTSDCWEGKQVGLLGLKAHWGLEDTKYKSVGVIRHRLTTYFFVLFIF